MFMRNLFIAFLPAAVIGAVMIKYIKALFHNPGVFVVTLIVGGLIMLWVERKPQYAKTAVPGADAQGDDSVSSRRATAHALEDISWKTAMAVGIGRGSWRERVWQYEWNTGEGDA